MKLTVLLENTACSEEFAHAHGLSILLETQSERILLDMGPGAQFAQNAQVLGIDLSQVDYAVLSHGHYDHGGGLDIFFRRNKTAPVYIAPGAFQHHTSTDGEEIGLPANLRRHPQIVTTADHYRIASNAHLFSAVCGTEFCSSINTSLLENGFPDAFTHEQNLLIEENGKMFLFGGCAHCGIVNILERAIELFGRAPDFVISGFHLAVKGAVSDDFVQSLGRRLLEYPTQFYTCHCTGEHPFALLKDIMGERIQALSTGMQLTL